MTASNAVQEAVWAALAAADVAGGRIYDDPENVVGEDWTDAYVDLGEQQYIARDVQCAAGGDDFLTLHIYSRAEGKQDVQDIAAAIDAALNGVSLTVSGRTFATAHVETIRTFREPDGRTRHGVVTVRVNNYQ